MEEKIIVKKKRVLKKGIKKVISICFILFFMATFSYSLYRIIRWNIDNNNNQKDIDLIFDTIIVTEIDDTPTVENVSKPENKEDPYWDYIKTKLINVDFTKLKEINEDTVAWVKVEGTNINYPVVQASDNSFYLDHSFNKSGNAAGWVFMDYRNNTQNGDKNTIIYAHGRLNGTMFGSLKNILNNGWLNNPDNFVIKLSSEKENTLWQVFSIYTIPETSDYLYVNPSEEEYLKMLNIIISRSTYDFKTTVGKDDRILTLSSCLNNDDRVVLHAKLIKKDKKIDEKN